MRGNVKERKISRALFFSHLALRFTLVKFDALPRRGPLCLGGLNCVAGAEPGVLLRDVRDERPPRLPVEG